MMKNIRSISFILLVISCSLLGVFKSLPALPQTTIGGKVVKRYGQHKTTYSVNQALVELYKVSSSHRRYDQKVKVYLTNSNGTYYLHDIPPGKYYIEVEKRIKSSPIYIRGYKEFKSIPTIYLNY